MSKMCLVMQSFHVEIMLEFVTEQTYKVSHHALNGTIPIHSSMRSRFQFKLLLFFGGENGRVIEDFVAEFQRDDVLNVSVRIERTMNCSVTIVSPITSFVGIEEDFNEQVRAASCSFDKSYGFS